MMGWDGETPGASERAAELGYGPPHRTREQNELHRRASVVAYDRAAVHYLLKSCGCVSCTDPLTGIANMARVR